MSNVTENVTGCHYNEAMKERRKDLNMQIYDNSYRTTLVCIDSYDDKILRGRLYNAFLESGIEFVGAISFLQNMENLFEQIKFPQAFSTTRTFTSSASQRPHMMTDQNVKVGKRATFSIRLLFRQNASWQGSVTWCEGKTEESFRSVLELLLLMDSALEANNT